MIGAAGWQFAMAKRHALHGGYGLNVSSRAPRSAGGYFLKQIVVFRGHLNATSTEIRRFRTDCAGEARRMTAITGMEPASFQRLVT